MMLDIIIALCIGIMCAVCYRIGFNNGLDRASEIIKYAENIMKEGNQNDT